MTREIRNAIMFVLVGACIILMICSLISDSISKRKRYSICLMSLSAMILLIADRLASLCNGSTCSIGFFVLRVSKFLVYCLFLIIILLFNHYLKDLLIKGNEIPRRLKCVEIVVAIGETMLTISQFTGIYYVFIDNTYQRENGYLIAYTFPAIALLIQLSTIIHYRANLSKRLLVPLVMFIVMPLIASMIQIFIHGASLTGISIVSMTTLLYAITILDTNKLVKIAHQKEIDILLEKEKNIKLMVEQTTLALVEAIDAKDNYTQGHSKRVAKYSAMIAKEAGKNQDECYEIYQIGLLHDVGKIGIPNAIINKKGKLTDEEYSIIKKHTILGKDILSKISISPKLSIGANYHHEKYDGTGYPEGLKGENIPEIARIIAVADSYDAMTSRRSYRAALPQNVVRNELLRGIGKQFDPDFAEIMIKLIDTDIEYQMREI